MQVKIKRVHPNAVIPKYAKDGDAGLDLTAINKTRDDYGNIVYGTGLAFEIPLGYVGLLFPRSSNSKTDLSLTNSVGVLDSGYRGEVMFKYAENYRKFPNKMINDDYAIGDRVGQLIIIPYPQIEFIESDELSETERGVNGYGHTGR